MIANPNFFSQAVHAIEKFHRALPKALRIRVQRWVEKLVSSGGNIAYVRHRDAYTKLMLNMILKRKLEEPFHTMPPDGQLPPFPSHLKILLKPPFGQEENEFWHGVVNRVHDEAAAHKDISTDTAIHGSRIAANNSSIYGMARSPYHGLDETTTPMKSAMHHPDNKSPVGYGAGVAGVMDVTSTPQRGGNSNAHHQNNITPGGGRNKGNHVAFSEQKQTTRGGGAAAAAAMGGNTPSKYGGVNHSSFVGGDAPPARRGGGNGGGAEESKSSHHPPVSVHHPASHNGGGYSVFDAPSFTHTSINHSHNHGHGGNATTNNNSYAQHGSAEYMRVWNRTKSQMPHLPEDMQTLQNLVREQMVRITILEEQLHTTGVQYETYIQTLEQRHLEEMTRLRVSDVSGNGNGVNVTSAVAAGDEYGTNNSSYWEDSHRVQQRLAPAAAGASGSKQQQQQQYSNSSNNNHAAKKQLFSGHGPGGNPHQSNSTSMGMGATTTVFGGGHNDSFNNNDASFRSSLDFAREYGSVDFESGVGRGVASGAIGDPLDTSMTGAGYPKLSHSISPRMAGAGTGAGANVFSQRQQSSSSGSSSNLARSPLAQSPSGKSGKDLWRTARQHHIHISSPPGKMKAASSSRIGGGGSMVLPESPIASVDRFDIKARPPPPAFPTSALQSSSFAVKSSSEEGLPASVQTQRWVNTLGSGN
jgi:hypothetical protein